MSGVIGSVAALAEYLVRIEVGHVVSSSSMVSRAYLTDDCVGVVVDAGESGLWLVSSLPALAPAPDGLRVRAAEKGGIPVDAGEPRLVKLTLGWGGSSVELKNPTVVGSDGVGVVSLAVPASFGERIRAGEGPRPVQLDGQTGSSLCLGAGLGIVVPTSEWAMVRWARVASDLGFGGQEGVVAIDAGIESGQAGAPVFVFGGEEPTFCGLAQSIGDRTSVLLPPDSILGAIAQAE